MPVLITTWYSFEAVLKVTLHMPNLLESNRIYLGKIQSRWRATFILFTALQIEAFRFAGFAVFGEGEGRFKPMPSALILVGSIF